MEPALKSSSISNSEKRLPAAFFLALAGIVLIETGLWVAYQSSATRYGGESSNWIHVKRIEKKQIDFASPVVILGDSTALPQSERWNQLGVVNLSIKVWDTMAGQYFILKKYLESGAHPKLCVLLTTDYFWEEDMRTPLALDKARGSFFRPLGSWSNALDLAFWAGRPDLAREMLVEGILPSKRFKGPISNWLDRLGVFHLEVRKANLWEEDARPMTPSERVAHTVRRTPIQLASLSVHYFNEINRLCQHHGIRLVVLESSISVSKKEEEALYQEYAKNLAQFLGKYDVPYLNRRFVFPDRAFGDDRVHLVGNLMWARFADAVFAEITPFLKRN